MPLVMVRYLLVPGRTWEWGSTSCRPSWHLPSCSDSRRHCPMCELCWPSLSVALNYGLRLVLEIFYGGWQGSRATAAHIVFVILWYLDENPAVEILGCAAGDGIYMWLPHQSLCRVTTSLTGKNSTAPRIQMPRSFVGILPDVSVEQKPFPLLVGLSHLTGMLLGSLLTVVSVLYYRYILIPSNRCYCKVPPQRF